MIDYTLHDTELIDWSLPPSKARQSAARMAEHVHGVRHPDLEPADCECYRAWRTHPGFGRVIKWQRAVNRRAAQFLEKEGYTPDGEKKP